MKLVYLIAISIFLFTVPAIHANNSGSNETECYTYLNKTLSTLTKVIEELNKTSSAFGECKDDLETKDDKIKELESAKDDLQDEIDNLKSNQSAMLLQLQNLKDDLQEMGEELNDTTGSYSSCKTAKESYEIQSEKKVDKGWVVIGFILGFIACYGWIRKKLHETPVERRFPKR